MWSKSSEGPLSQKSKIYFLALNELSTDHWCETASFSDWLKYVQVVLSSVSFPCTWKKDTDSHILFYHYKCTVHRFIRLFHKDRSFYIDFAIIRTLGSRYARCSRCNICSRMKDEKQQANAFDGQEVNLRTLKRLSAGQIPATLVKLPLT